MEAMRRGTWYVRRGMAICPTVRMRIRVALMAAVVTRRAMVKSTAIGRMIQMKISRTAVALKVVESVFVANVARAAILSVGLL